jgi:hypothetical protein
VDATPFAGRLVQEARGLVEDAQGRGATVRLMGGVGIRLLLEERMARAFERPYRDLDIFISRSERREVEATLTERGWRPATAFNALGGGRRLLFEDPGSEAQVDVFVDVFEMCHRLPLKDSLGQPGPSLPATDLLMSKLQIVELNAKDRHDCYALLAACPIGDHHRALDTTRIAELTGADWGLHHTFELNLRRLSQGVDDAALPADHSATVTAVVDRLAAAMADAPKSRGWKLRARIGERKRWYEEPEEVER